MNKNIFVILITVSVILSSCGINKGLTSNVNNHQTDVVLSNKNYKVIAKVEGSARASYFLGIGGISKFGLISNARSKMLADAQLIGKPRAVINETVEINTRFILIYEDYTVTVSAYIIEFYNDESEVNMTDTIFSRSAQVKSNNQKTKENITNNKVVSYEIGEKVKFYDKNLEYYINGIITNIESNIFTIEYSNLFKKATIKVDKSDVRKQ